MNSKNCGPCLVCGRPILYLGGSFCSPGCNFDHIAGRARAAAPEPVLEPVFVAVPAQAVGPAVPEKDPPEEEREPSFSGFMFLEPPPDE